MPIIHDKRPPRQRRSPRHRADGADSQCRNRMPCPARGGRIAGEVAMSHDPHANRRDLLKLAGAASLATLGTALPPAAEAAAPMLGVLRPSIYRFKLGEFEITN